MKNSVPPGTHDPADLMVLMVPVGDGVLVGAFGRLCLSLLPMALIKTVTTGNVGEKGEGQYFIL